MMEGRLPSLAGASASNFSQPQSLARRPPSREFQFQVKPSALGIKPEDYQSAISDKDYSQMKLKDIQHEHRLLLQILSKYSQFLTTLVQRKKTKKTASPRPSESIENVEKMRQNNIKIIDKYQKEIRQLSAQQLDDPTEIRVVADQTRARIGLLQRQVAQIKRDIKLKDREIIQNEQKIPQVQGILQDDFLYSKRYNQQLLQKRAKLELLNNTEPIRSQSVREDLKSRVLADKQREYEELVQLLQRKKVAFQKNFESKRRAILMTEESIARQERQLRELRF